jgi:hypothetical protein
MLARDKHFSLFYCSKDYIRLGFLVRYKRFSLHQSGRKCYIALTPGANVVKLFFFVADERAKTSEIVCPWQAFPA